MSSSMASSSSLSPVIEDKMWSSSMARRSPSPFFSSRMTHLEGSSWSSITLLGIETDRDVKPKLTKSSTSSSRSSRRSIPPLHNPSSGSPPVSAISDLTTYNFTPHRQDVPSAVSESRPTHPNPSNVYPPSPLESPLSTFTSFESNYDSLNNNQRLRSTTQVFNQLPELAAHYGIPQLLPPAPRTTPAARHQPLQPAPASQPSNESFKDLCSNYLNMLAQKLDDSTMTSTTTSPATPFEDSFAAPVSTEAAVQNILEALSASANCSPEFDYLTSPIFGDAGDDFSLFGDYLRGGNLATPNDSPYLATPSLDQLGSDFLTSPVVADDDSFGDMDMPLFADMASIYESMPPPAPKSMPPPAASRPVDFETMYTMSPMTPMTPLLDTPYLNPTSLYNSPRLPSNLADQHNQPQRRKSSATGTRKNVTPETLVPLDAPTQPRKYALPSATSRKELPAVFAKKRSRSQAFADDEDEQAEEPLPPNATEKEQIEWKRRQNTLAARKSRKRKLQHQLELEDTITRLNGEVETWKSRALVYEGLLRHNNIMVPQSV